MKSAIKPQTLKGFRDFLPGEALARQHVIQKMRRVFERFGYDPLETPALEYAEVLTGKYGDEADKLLYLFEDRGNRQVGLRYDQTVPTARVIGQYPDLAKPFKRYQIQSVWRQENPQQGRFREFLQCDADIFAPALTALMDAEPIAVIYFILKELGFQSIKIIVNSRSLLFSLMASAEVPRERWLSTLTILDKLEKIGIEQVTSDLKNKLQSDELVNGVFRELQTAEPDDGLEQIIEAAVQCGVARESIVFSPTLVRGLDYYTGVIYEGRIPGYEAGSVVGGGRYDKLVGSFFGQDIPGSGFAFGFDRVLEALEQSRLLPQRQTVALVLVTIFSPALLKESQHVATFLRDKDINTEIYLDPSVKLDKQLKYADKKGIPFVIIIGPEEVERNVVTLKDLRKKEQKTLSLVDALFIILNS